MNDDIRRDLRQLIGPLKALAESVNRSMDMGMTAGAGTMAGRSYRALHGKIAALLADDLYVTEALALPEDIGEQQLAAVHMAVNQLVPYIESLARDATTPAGCARPP